MTRTNMAMHRRAQECIAQTYLTNSKRAESHVKGVYPTHVARGQGPFLFDHQGNKYLDFVCGLGTNLLGYGNDRVSQAISRELRNGFSHSLATHHELETAEKAKELFPFVDCWKFLKSGSEACSAALRIARAATGRECVLSEGYHGWHDPFVSLTVPALGVPRWPSVSANPMFKLNSPQQIGQGIAAVIVEPVITDASPLRKAFLEELRERCTQCGTLLIFDEVITGFRWPKFSVAADWNITPDLIVLGKAMGGGLPLAAVGGKYDVMNSKDYFVSSSYAGETLSLVAAKEVMTLLQTRYEISQLWEAGQAFTQQLNAIWPAFRLDGYPTRGVFTGDPLVKALFFQECCDAGLLFGPSWFLSFAHLGEMAGVLDVCRDVLTRIRAGSVKLEGQMPQSPFAQRQREDA